MGHVGIHLCHDQSGGLLAPRSQLKRVTHGTMFDRAWTPLMAGSSCSWS